MKNKLLSIFSVLLISCQYSPAYAQIVDKTLNTTTLNLYADVVEQYSIIFPVSSQKQEYSPCLTIADFSFNAMLAHQYGVSEEDQLSLAPVPTTQEEAMLKVLLDGIVHDATIFPVYDDMSDKIEVSERFSKVIYDICIGGK